MRRHGEDLLRPTAIAGAYGSPSHRCDGARADIVAYRPAPGFAFEARFIEAVALIWQWAEGKGLIQDAGSNSVFVVTVPEQALPTSFAGYVPTLKGIGVSRRFTQASTWMIADVLAHEMKHASDDFQGQFRGTSYDACITREQRAYEVESRFLRWLSNRMGGLPSAREVAARLSADDNQLYINIRGIADSPNPSALASQDYRRHCAERAARSAALEQGILANEAAGRADSARPAESAIVPGASS